MENKTILMQQESHVGENEVFGTSSKGLCGCFNFSCLKWNRSYNNIDEEEEEEQTEKWWEYKLNKLKQFSEKVAGPKWKNFIRKMGGYCHKRKKNKFQYDPQSYALNFDDGDDKEGDGLLLQSSNSRFVAPFDVDDRQRAAAAARSGI